MNIKFCGWMALALFLGCAARETSSKSFLAVEDSPQVSKNREQIAQLGIKLATLDQRMARVEESVIQTIKGLRELRKDLAKYSKNESFLQEMPKIALPELKPIAGRKKWKKKSRKLAMKIIKDLQNSHDEPKTPQRQDIIGSKLPIIRFIASNGDLLDISDYQGKKKVLLVILRGFGGSVCVVCSSQTIALGNRIDEFKAKNTEVILVYPGEADTVPGFLEAVENLQEGFKPPFPIVLDVDLALVDKFKIKGDLAKPTSIIIDKQGVVRYAYVGKNVSDRPPVNALLRELDRIDGKKMKASGEKNDQKKKYKSYGGY